MGFTNERCKYASQMKDVNMHYISKICPCITIVCRWLALTDI